MQLINRDISWLSFNERLLLEAANASIPIMERFKFLSIFSSNLDEFSKVRIPAIHKEKSNNKKPTKSIDTHIQEVINKQQVWFGNIINELISSLAQQNYNFIYHEQIPSNLMSKVTQYFYTQIAGLLKIDVISSKNVSDFFPENNQIYIAVEFKAKSADSIAIINIPSNKIERFYYISDNDIHHIIFIDDIIKAFLHQIFPDKKIKGAYSFKVNRDADLNIINESEGNLARKVMQQITKRDFGRIAKFLYDGEMPKSMLNLLLNKLNLQNAVITRGGNYHNLKDLNDLKIDNPTFYYERWNSITPLLTQNSLLQHVLKNDMMLYTPFHHYDMVLRFFNEAAIDPQVTEINMSMYRIASQSKIAEALISAAHNGKKVTVFMEVKARFDEANNFHWAHQMQKAGVRIIYSIPEYKVHAKVVLIKRQNGKEKQLLGILGTGNFNEITAKYYTDYLLLTADISILNDLDKLFKFLKKNNKTIALNEVQPKQLLIAPFNMRTAFEHYINEEINAAKKGNKGYIRIKINNLEDEMMIRKLYQAADAGVVIELLVRGICRLDHHYSNLITVKRIVDRYLEHGRIYYFYNGGKEPVFVGSADWMNRNLSHRIEVCFPILHTTIKNQLIHVLDIYWSDNTKATYVDELMHNLYFKNDQMPVAAQKAMSEWVAHLENN